MVRRGGRVDKVLDQVAADMHGALLVGRKGMVPKKGVMGMYSLPGRGLGITSPRHGS